jgi:hypothetical protein
MSEQLHCTQDPQTGEWQVWWQHPQGWPQVLESFDTESEARAFWQEQIDDSDDDAG